MTPGATVAVVGGGIAGLAAAWELAGAAPTARVVVLEASERPGGKIRTGSLEGRPVDLGPDAFLARRPEAVELCREIGLGDELVAPGARRAYVWSRGALRPLPDGLALGIPTRVWPVLRSGILSPRGVARAGLDLVTPARARHTGAPADRAIGDLVAGRLGHEVVERFVDPLVGGIHAGRVATMSAAAVFPPLLGAAARGGSLLRALRAAVPAAPPGDAPVFLAPRRGVGTLVDALGAALVERGVEVRCSSPVATLARAGEPDGGRWRVETGAGALTVDGVVVAVPAAAAGALLSPLDAELGRMLQTIHYASVAVVTLVVPASSVGRPLDGTGFLVPAVEDRLTTACTWMTAKWPHLGFDDDVVVLRASAGRYGDERALALDDDELTAAVVRELAPMMRLGGPVHTAVVTRWGSAFPQYAVGHLDLVARMEAAAGALRGVALAGAAYGGVGIPACIASGRRAARLVVEAAVPA